MTCLLCSKYNQKAGGKVLPEKLTGGVHHPSWNPFPISDQNLRFSLPYFRPEALESGAWPERVTICYGTYTVVGVNIKREMGLSPYDEEVANSSKKHTQFKTRVHKPYPISDQNSGNWYPVSDQNGWKMGAKNALQITSLAAYASEINKLSHFVRTLVALCNKLEMDGRRTSKLNNKYHHHHHHQQQQKQQQQQQQ